MRVAVSKMNQKLTFRAAILGVLVRLKCQFLTRFSHKCLIIIILLPVFAFFTGCVCPKRFWPQANPPPLPDCYVPSHPKVAVVLGGGGIKGLAHVGVLDEFQKANIPIDMVVGCSAGAIVGALYCDDPDIRRLRRVLEPLRATTMLDMDLWTARYGLCQGNQLKRLLTRHLHAKYFDELQIPFVCVSTDLHSAELVVLGGGEIIPSVMASAAVPFAFVPIQLHGRVLVDGGIINPVPVEVAKHFGAEVVICIDIGGLLPKTFPTNLFGVATRSAEITLLWQSEACQQGADVIIKPINGYIGTFANDQNEFLYETGRHAAKEAIPRIIQVLQERNIPYCPPCE